MVAKLVILGLALLARSLLAQESALIISQPRLSVKTFTNWQLIKLTYTISYLNNYDFLSEYAKPENMSFGPLELDPILGKKQIIENRRSVGNQVSLDLIYYLRHVGDKKGEIPVPEQVFKYTKLVAGKRKEGEEAFEIRSEPIILRYDSVLTKDADDIMDEIDFGSFQRQATFWKYGAVAGFLVSLAGVLLLIFKNPFRRRLVAGEIDLGQEATSEEDEHRLAPEEALELFNRRLDEIKTFALANRNDQFSSRAQLSNELRSLLLAFVPRLLPSDTIAEIRTKMAIMESGMVSKTLGYLVNWLEVNDNILYGLGVQGNVDADISTIQRITHDLKWHRIALSNFVAKLGRLKNRITRSRAIVIFKKLTKAKRQEQK